MNALQALKSSVERLGTIVGGLDDAQLSAPSFASEWTIADVLSHLGSGDVIWQRGLADAERGETTPDDFPQSVWGDWNAKTPREKADSVDAADQQLVDFLDSLSADEWERIEVPVGPLHMTVDDFVGLRVNEYTLHTWDIAVALDPAATLSSDAVALVIDKLDVIQRYTARPTGASQTITVHTSDPPRVITLVLAPDAVTVTPGGDAPDVTLPAEQWIRLVYGRATPRDESNPIIETLRAVFPGP